MFPGLFRVCECHSTSFKYPDIYVNYRTLTLTKSLSKTPKVLESFNAFKIFL